MDVSVRKVHRRAPEAKRPREVRRERAYGSWLVVHLHVDVCDAMGANCASAVAEGTAPLIASLTGGRIGLRIVSNLSIERMAKVRQFAYQWQDGECFLMLLVYDRHAFSSLSTNSPTKASQEKRSLSALSKPMTGPAPIPTAQQHTIKES